MNPFESFGNKIKDGFQNMLESAGFGPSSATRKQERLRLALRELPGGVLDIYNFLETAAERSPLSKWEFRSDYLTKSKETVDQFQIHHESSYLTLVRRKKSIFVDQKFKGIEESYRVFIRDDHSRSDRPLPMSEELIGHLMQTIDVRRARMLQSKPRLE